MPVTRARTARYVRTGQSETLPIINQAIAYLEKTEHIEGREERRGRTSGTFYYATEGTTEYTPAATSNGLGIEPANSHTANGKLDPTDADAFIQPEGT